MSISSVSLTFFSMVNAPATNAPVAPVPAAANDAAEPVNSSREGHGHARRNVLYDAMLSALRELGPTQKPAQPATPDAAGGSPATVSPASIATTGAGATPATTSAASTPAADAGGVTTPPPASTPPQSIEDAVMSFADALMQALRGADNGGSRRGRDGDDDGDDDGEGHRHGHRGDMERSYSGLASRIETLAVRFVVAAPAAPATTPATTLVASTEPATNPALVKLPGTDPVGTDAATAPPATQVTTPAVLPAVPAKNSLAEAFAAMLKALRGGDATPTTPTTPASTDNSLAMFLHSLARGLAPDHSMHMTSGLGMMINITA